MTFNKLRSGDLDSLIPCAVGTIRPCHDSDDKDVHYLHLQNGNLYSQNFFSNGEDASGFAALRADVSPEINFVCDALGSSSVLEHVLRFV